MFLIVLGPTFQGESLALHSSEEMVGRCARGWTDDAAYMAKDVTYGMVMNTFRRRVLGCSALSLGLLVWSGSSVAAQMTPSQYVQRTAHYTVVLNLGSPEEMISPSDAATAKSGEVMASSVGMMDTSRDSATGMSGMGAIAPSRMPSMDQGMPFNEHLEIHVTQNDTGAVVNDVTPVLRVTDKLTGASRTLDQVTAMYGVQEGPSEWHYGQNLYLLDGTYQVTAMIGSDTAQFRDIVASAGTSTPAGPTGGMSSPATGMMH